MKFNSKSVMFLVTINVLVFLFISNLHIIPQNLFALYFPDNDQFAVWQFISYLFLHGSFTHLLFNMFALYAFGSVLESLWGTRRFLSFYFIAGIGAALVYTLVNYYEFNNTYNQLLGLGLNAKDIQAALSSGTINNQVLKSISETQLMEFFATFHTPAVGASGAIYGILIAYAITFPNAKLALIFFPVPVSAKYFVPVLILVDLFFGMTKYSIGNVAHFAHIGGAIFGLLIMLWWRQKGKNLVKNPP